MKAKTVLVTGAAGIIGPAIVQRLIAEGWNVAATDRNQEEFEIGEKLLGVPFEGHRFIADLGSRSGCTELVAEVEKALGPIHAIVNNATVNFGRDFDRIDEEAAKTEFAVNFLAPLWLTHAAKPSLQATKGCVVNMSSIQVVKPLKNSFIYTCTKAALENAVSQLAGLFLEEGIRFNGIRIGQIPGFAFLRPTAQQLSEEDAVRMARELLPLHYENSRKRTGEQCIGTPEEVADLVAFLLKPESRFLNGEIIALDGGLSRRFFPPSSKAGTCSHLELVQQWLDKNPSAIQ